MKCVMKRVLTAAAMVAAVWMFALGHVDATTARSTRQQVSCHQIRAALQAGKSMKQVEKEFKVSSKHVRQCEPQKTTAAATPRR